MPEVICPFCGAKIPEGSRYCPSCGSSLTGEVGKVAKIEDCRHSRERPLFWILAILGALTYLSLFVLLVVVAGKSVGYVFAFPIAIGAALALFGLGLLFHLLVIRLFRAGLLNDAIRASPEQFPKVYNAVRHACEVLGYTAPLEIYILQKTIYNALIAGVLGTRCLVIFSQLLEGIYEEDEAALRALMGYLIGHFRLGHLRWRWLLLGGGWVPFLYLLWLRVTVYSADRCAYLASGNDLQATERVLAILAAGGRLAKYVRSDIWFQQATEAEVSPAARALELLSPHPPLAKRLRQLRHFALGPQAVPIKAYAGTTLLGAILSPFGTHMSLISIFSIVSIIAILAAILYPVFSRAREKAMQAQCMSNLRQIGIALMMYTQDWDETFPGGEINWEEQLGPYVKNRLIFSCPADRNGPPSYQFNPSLRGVSLAGLPNLAETIAIFESDNGKTIAYRHNDGAIYCFADGHIKWLVIGGEEKMKFTVPFTKAPPLPAP